MLRTYLFGIVFGFLLSRIGATDHTVITGMFRLQDPHLAGVMGVGIAVAALGFAWMRWSAVSTLDGGQPPMSCGAPRPAWLLGGVLFGAGWALTGSCPGTALAQIGEGRLMGLFTVAGLFLGTALYRWKGARIEEVFPGA